MEYALAFVICACMAALLALSYALLKLTERVIETSEVNASIERTEYTNLLQSALGTVERLVQPPAQSKTPEDFARWLSENTEWAPIPTEDWTDELVPDVPFHDGEWADEVVPGVPIEDPFDPQPPLPRFPR